MCDLSKDHISVRGPLERFGILVGGGDVIFDGFLKFFYTAEDASSDDFVSYFCEPALDLVEP